jgi:DNA-binding transcriptional LysR family regulator
LNLNIGTVMNLDDLSDFVLVASNGGYTQASRVSGRPKASLSRKVMALEAALGVRLFERGARAIHVTEEGALLLERASGPLHEITEATQVLRDGRTKPNGRLRINVPTLFGQLLMGRLAAEFSMAYPEVRLSVTMEDRAVDLVREGYDLVIRVNPEPNSELVGRCFVRDQVLVVSTPVFKAQFFKATSPAQPLPVVLRNSARSRTTWPIADGLNRELATQPVLELPTLSMVRDAVLTGIGAGKLPSLLVAEDLKAGRLVSWGPSSDQPSELWVLHASRRFASAKVNAFIRFLETAFPGDWM